MKWILSRDGRAALARIAGRRPLVALDFDGTLAPIVRDPSRAAMRPRTRGLLRRVAALYPCVVISGRALRDLRGRLRETGVRRAIGNHGGEPTRQWRAVRARVRRWQAALARRLGGLRGVTIEDKGLSLAIHYRHARPRAAAESAVRAAAARLAGARIVGGKCVVNVVPRRAPNKGVALEALRRRLRRACAVYVGDDDTDEDAFALAASGRLLGIRVGRKPASKAHYYLRAQSEVDALLAVLVRSGR
jgi:trehalose 6-phosphate phosphatase